ncbi:hypothetical protein Pfo_007549 [Paulownia fortunei]|nr:hypothetical protein Pfo_007549 [Paulownia fortunei]
MSSSTPSPTQAIPSPMNSVHTHVMSKYNDQLVFFGKVIKGKLGYGKVSGVSGIQAKKFFIWVPVTGIDADEKNGMTEFYMGSISQKLPAKDFETIHSCKAKGLRESKPNLKGCDTIAIKAYRVRLNLYQFRKIIV